MIQSTIALNEAKPLPDGWRWVRLGEVCEFLDHLRIPVNDVDRHLRTAGKKQSELYPYYGANGQVDWIDDYLFDEELVLLAEDGGFFGSFDRPVAYKVSGKCWVNNHAHVLRAKKELVDVDWLHFSVAIRPDIIRFVSGTTRPKLTQDQAALVPIPLPPLPEQKRIAAKVQELMKEIERARRACEARLEAAKALPQAHLRQVFESEEAKKWERKKLGELFDVQQGVAMSPYRREGVAPRPFLRTLNVLWGRVDLSTLDKMDFTDGEVSRLSLKLGDLLVCEGGEVGRTAIWRGELDTCLYQNHIHRLRKINGTVVSEFYMYWMQAAFQVFKSYSGEESATTIPNLSENRLKTFLFPFPPARVQARIATELQAKMEESEKLAASIEKQLETIKALPQAILRKAFRGEL